MGHSRGGSKNTPKAQSATKERTYMRRLSDSAVGLEDGDQWKDSYSVRPSNQTYHHVRAGTGGMSYFGGNGSEKDLRNDEAHGNTSGILKSTRIVVEHGRK